MATIPNEWYITGYVLSYLVTWLEQKLGTEVDDSNAAKVKLVKIGPRQQDPVAVGLFLYENDLADPEKWPHGQDILIGTGSSQRMTGIEGAQIRRLPVGRQTIGSEPEWSNQRCFTVLQEVWLDKVPGLERTEENLALLSQAVAGRVRQCLKDGGLTLGTGNIVADNFGEYITEGPFFGSEYLKRQVGKQLFTSRYLQFWYRTSEH